MYEKNAFCKHKGKSPVFILKNESESVDLGFSNTRYYVKNNHKWKTYKY